jgi:cell division protein FtsI/penicillin-binding protein 2
VVHLDEGTGRAAAVEDVDVVGKTGTADHPPGQFTAVFVGVTPAPAPTVVAVVVEGVPTTETGGTVAASSFARIVERVQTASGG